MGYLAQIILNKHLSRMRSSFNKHHHPGAHSRPFLKLNPHTRGSLQKAPRGPLRPHYRGGLVWLEPRQSPGRVPRSPGRF